MPVSKARLLIRRPDEAGARIRNKLSGWADALSRPCGIRNIFRSDEWHDQLSHLLDVSHPESVEPALSSIEDYIAHQEIRMTGHTAPFSSSHSGTATLGRLCYWACRWLRPQVVVETGVAYGVTSTYLLQALSENQNGDLHSIDLPPLAIGAENHVGAFVPPALRLRWHLRKGSAKTLLPKVVRETGLIDLFVHDSLHTYSHMKWELEMALAALRPGGIVIVDDIDGNRAFEEAVQRPEVDRWFAIRQDGKETLCGAMRTKSKC